MISNFLGHFTGTGQVIIRSILTFRSKRLPKLNRIFHCELPDLNFCLKEVALP